MITFTTIPVPIGSVVALAEDGVLREMTMTKRDPEQAQHWMSERRPDARFGERQLPTLRKQIRDYFDGKPVRFDADFDISHMTPFQRRVLEACAELDYGQTTTYGELARRIGRPGAGRAVGAALGRNPIPLVIPCHRVVGCNGGLGGFSAEQGIAVKRWLLDMEAGNRRPRL